MTRRRHPGAVFKDTRGATAIEFAIYSTAFFAMLFGAIYASILGYSNMSLHAAVESAARCRSMGITCTDAATTRTFADKKFHNMTGNNPVFTADTQTCGYRVQGTVNFKLEYILGQETIPLSASACFP